MIEKKTKIALLFLLLILIGLGSGCIGSDKSSASAADREVNRIGPETRNINESGEKPGINENASEEAVNRSIENITETLIENLENGDSETRMQAIEALGEYTEPEVLQALVRTLEDEDEEIQLGAVRTLGKIGKPAADVLIEKLEGGDFNNYALLALIETGDARASETLSSLFEKRRETANRAAVEKGLENRGSVEMLSAVEAREKSLRKIIAGELEGEKEEGLEALIKALNSDNPGVETYSEIALMETKKAGGSAENESEQLIKALDSENGCIRIAAALALGEMKEERAVDEMLPILGQDYAVVRSSVAFSLGKIGDEKAVERLLQELKHSSNEWTRSCAALALGEIGKERASTLLIQRLRDTEKDVRYSSILALGLIGDEKAVDPLLEILEIEENSGIQDPMKKDMGIRKNAIVSLGELGSNRSEETLIKILKNEEEKEEIRIASAKALGKTGSSRAVKALVSVVEDEKAGQELRTAALLAFGETDNMEAAEVLIEYLDDAKLGTSAEKALKTMGETALEPLIRALESGDEELKTEAAFLLMEIGDERAIEPLIKTYNIVR